MKNDKTKTAVDWSRFQWLIDEVCQKHREFVNSWIGKKCANGNPHYGDEWLFICWRNPQIDLVEIYYAGDVPEAQQIIDGYHFSQVNTKVFVRATGEDVTDRIKFDPCYHDTFVI